MGRFLRHETLESVQHRKEAAGVDSVGRFVIHKYGHNADVGTSWEAIWDGGGAYNWISTAATAEQRNA